MQNSSIGFLLSEIKNIIPPLKNLSLVESHVGYKIIDLITFKPKKILSAKVCLEIETVSEGEDVIIDIIVLKHYQNYFNKKIPYKITALHKNHKVNLIFFSKYTGYLKKIFLENKKIMIKGKIENYKNSYQITHPEIIKATNLINNNVFLKVVYRQRKTLKSETIHALILKVCASLPEIEEWNCNLFKLYKEAPSFKESILNIHNPSKENTISETSPYILRLAYDEIFSYQLSLAILRDNLNKLSSNFFECSSEKAINYMSSLLPFEITKDQKNAAKEIINDVKSRRRTLRLLQGDVGSGKTVTAAISAYFVLNSGYQVAILTPTELLAKQHYDFFSKIFAKENINIQLLISSSVNKKSIKNELNDGKINLIIGTHTLLQKDVKFNNLSFVIIDEQHRFGVEQRIKLRNKGKQVDMLLLTATPIPRTMMLTVLGDIAVSTIKEKPFSSKTKTILKNENNINQVLSFLNNKISSGAKVFWVCPKIDNEETGYDTSVQNRFLYLKKIYTNIATLHGKMSSIEKSKVLDDFRKGNINIIVSTVVIEVGIDVPDANIIVIDNANVFGLAQIHQLRGRVGRGEEEGTCILMYNNNLTDIALQRLSILKQTQNGFEIAEKDLKLRGAGELIGTKQYGSEDFKFFNYEYHYQLAQTAMDEAKALIKIDPMLKSARGIKLKMLLKLFKKDAASNLLSAG